jgi:hypothetical protein
MAKGMGVGARSIYRVCAGADGGGLIAGLVREVGERMRRVIVGRWAARRSGRLDLHYQ